MTPATKVYSPAEERLNVRSHLAGLILSIVALALMLIRAGGHGDRLEILSVTVFGLSLIALYAASSLYHAARDPQRRARLRVLDHSMIYVLIAGTYTPVTLLALPEKLGWTLFAITWGLALMGVMLKLGWTGKFTWLSTLLYVAMGWMIVFAVKPFLAAVPLAGAVWLFAGGLAYTLGAVLYGIGSLRFNHAIFHCFAVLGSFCHFVAVYQYIQPL